MTDDEDFDELAEAAGHEWAGRIAARRRLRAWLMAAGAGASVILLAVTAVSLLHGPIVPADRRADVPIFATPPVEDVPIFATLPVEDVLQDLRDQARAGAVQTLSTIPLPKGWSRGPVAPGTGDGGTLQTTWIAPAGTVAAPAAVASTLRAAGFTPCLVPAEEPSSVCWERSPEGGVIMRPGGQPNFPVTLMIRPDDGCSAKSCHQLAVELVVFMLTIS